MGIRFLCPNGHKLNIKSFLAGKRGVCPKCGARFIIPLAEVRLTVAATTAPADALSSEVGTDSVSVLIDVEESRGPAAPPTKPPLPTAIPAPPPAAAPPPTADFTAVPAARSAAPVSIYAIRQRRNRKLQMQLAVVLLLVVVVLALVLIWVLNRGAPETTAQRLDPSHLVAAAARAYAAEAAPLVR